MWSGHLYHKLSSRGRQINWPIKLWVSVDFFTVSLISSRFIYWVLIILTWMFSSAVNNQNHGGWYRLINQWSAFPCCKLSVLYRPFDSPLSVGSYSLVVKLRSRSVSIHLFNACFQCFHHVVFHHLRCKQELFKLHHLVAPSSSTSV